MYTQPFIGSSVDTVYTPSFGGSLYSPGPQKHEVVAPSTRTQSPIVTGTSVIGIVHAEGVVLGADTLASYGSLARFMDIERLVKISDNTVLGGSGEFSDFQEILEMIDGLVKEDYLQDDGNVSTPREIHRYLTRVMYGKRNRMDPFWNQIVIAGFRDTPFLGTVDLHGTSYEDTTIATGYGAHIARPLLRNAYRPDLTEEQAVKVIEDCMRVLYYRDARAQNRIQVARIRRDAITVSQPYSLDTYWLHGENINRAGSF